MGDGLQVVVLAGAIFVALFGTMYAAEGATGAVSLRIMSVASSEAESEAAPPPSDEGLPAGHDVPEELLAMLDANREEIVDPVTGVRMGPLTVRPAPEPASTSPVRPARPPRARPQPSVRRPTATPPRLHPDPGHHVVATARAMIAQREAIMGSCHKYLTEVFARAGHDHWRTRRIAYQEGSNGPYAALDLIRPGDWLYIVNHPDRDPVGTHSVLFVSWEDRARGIARVIEHPGWGAPASGRERSYDVSRTYRITRPVLERR